VSAYVVTIGLGCALVLGMLALWRVLEQRNTLRAALDRERRLAALGEMSSVLAHELRNPIASLKGHAQLLSEALPDDSNTQKKADRIVAEATRLESISNDLLDFIRAGKPALEQINPRDLLQAAADSVNPDRIEVDTLSAPSRWALDPVRMQQVLTNLLTNAIQASPAGSGIELTADVQGRNLSIEVRDHGDGIQSGTEELIFEPFHTTRVRGTGLGLAITRRIVEAHGGSVAASNHPRGGALFKLTLPPN